MPYHVAALAMLMLLFTQSCKKEVVATNADTDTNLKLPPDNFASLAVLNPSYVYTLAGDPYNYGIIDGRGANAGFKGVSEMVALDGYLYVVDFERVIRKIKISDRSVITLAGSDTPGDPVDGKQGQARFKSINSIAIGPDGNLYVADGYSVRKITRQGVVTTLAGANAPGNVNGPVKTARFGQLYSIAVGKDGTVYIYDQDASQIKKITKAGMVSAFTAPGPFSGAYYMSVASNGIIYTAYGGQVNKITPDGTITNIVTNNNLNIYDILALDNGMVMISSNNQLFLMQPDGRVQYWAGLDWSKPFNIPADGHLDTVDLLSPSGLTVENKILYFASHPDYVDNSNPRPAGSTIRMTNLSPYVLK